MYDLAEPIKNFYHKKRVLITGAGGYVGSRVVEMLSDVDCTIVRFSRKILSPRKNIKATIKDARGDLSTFNDWDNIIADIDIIFHFAAQTGIKTADDYPTQDAGINVIGTLKILESAKKYKNKVLILAGSTTECGVQKTLPVNETANDAPVTLYDINKCITEKYLQYFCEKRWVRGTCLRLANVYGPGAKNSDSSRGVLNQVTENALSGKEITIFNGGAFIRDYVYIDDVAQAFLLAANHVDKLSNAYYIVGSGVGTTINAAFSLVISLVSDYTSLPALPLRNIICEQSAIDQRNFIADSTAFSTATGWQSKTSLKTGILMLIESIKNHVYA